MNGGFAGGYAGGQCQTVTEMVPCTRTVMQQQPRTTEVTVNVCKTVPVQREGKRMVQTVVPHRARNHRERLQDGSR
jgi:hypothetical protein